MWGVEKTPRLLQYLETMLSLYFTLIVFSGESIFGGRSQIKRCPLVVVLVVYMVLLQDPVALPVPRRTPSLVVKAWQQQKSDIDS